MFREPALSTATRPVVLISGVSRAEGLGFETARQMATNGYLAIITARDGNAARRHATTLAAEGLAVVGRALDITDPHSVSALVAGIAEDFGRLDALINNAAIGWDFEVPTLEARPEDVRAALETNVFGAWALVNASLPLLKASPHPAIVNVSSEAASFNASYGMSQRGPTLAAYAISKAALNALTVKLGVALTDTRIRINAVCPGWVATYPGTAEMGARPVSDGARGIVWAATLPPDGPSGGFFRDGVALAW